MKMHAKTKNSSLTPPSAERSCAPAAASRSLPAAWTTALASTKRSRWWLAAR
jgi:hypothetical protein